MSGVLLIKTRLLKLELLPRTTDQIAGTDFGSKTIWQTDELDFAGLKLYKNRCRFLINQFICANFCFLHAYCTLPTLADIKHREEKKERP